MPGKVDRRTVDLSAYPDLVVIYLGMRVNTLTGLKTVLRISEVKFSSDTPGLTPWMNHRKRRRALPVVVRVR